MRPFLFLTPLLLAACATASTRFTKSEHAAADAEFAAVAWRTCGPEGVKRNPDPPTPLVRGLDCRRYGWDGTRYRY